MRIPKYRKHATRDKAFYEHHGRRRYLPGVYGSKESIDAYNAFLKTLGVIRSGMPDTPPPPRNDITVGAIAARYLTYAAAYFGDDSHSRYQHVRMATERLLKQAATVRAVDFGPRLLKQWRDDWANAGTHARTYINDHLSCIKAMFKWAASEELIDGGVYHAISTVPGLKRGRSKALEHPPREPAAWEDVKPVFKYLTPVVKSMLWLQWYTGCRSQSVCLAKPSQFDEDNDLMLWRPIHKTEYLGKEVVLPIGPQCCKQIAKYLNRGDDAFMFNPQQGKNGTNRRYGDHYKTWTYRQALVRAQVKAQEAAAENDERIPLSWTPHALRHARGTIVRAEFGIEAAQAVLGHESLAATQVYAERRLELAKKIARQIG